MWMITLDSWLRYCGGVSGVERLYRQLNDDYVATCSFSFPPQKAKALLPCNSLCFDWLAGEWGVGYLSTPPIRRPFSLQDD